MSLFRKFLSLVMVLLCLCLPIRVYAVQADYQDYVQQMLQYYLWHQEAAEEEIQVLLDYLNEIDSEQGRMWRGLMEDWSFINSRLPITPKMLPDGLPEDDTLCIVIMGLELNADGTMKEELIDRLIAGLSSALKYPNAYVAVTGGNTSEVKGVTEAGQMAHWLRERGITEEKLIVDEKAYSTIQNAENVCNILANSYPQVTSLAIVTSDYHIKRSCAMFAAQTHTMALQKGTQPLTLAGTAVNQTDKQSETLKSQLRGICTITGVVYDYTFDIKPELAE